MQHAFLIHFPSPLPPLSLLSPSPLPSLPPSLPLSPSLSPYLSPFLSGSKTVVKTPTLTAPTLCA